MGMYKTAADQTFGQRIGSTLKRWADALDVDEHGVPRSVPKSRARGVARAIYETAGGTRVSPPGVTRRVGFGHPDKRYIDLLNRRMGTKFTLSDASNWNTFVNQISPAHDASVRKIHARNGLQPPTEHQYMMSFRRGMQGRNREDTENYTPRAWHDAALFYAQPADQQKSVNGKAPEAARRLYADLRYRKALENWLSLASPARRMLAKGLGSMSRWFTPSGSGSSSSAR